jgi:hypothetical protein
MRTRTGTAFYGKALRTSANHDVASLVRSAADSPDVNGAIGPLTEDQLDDLLIMDTLSVPLRRLPLNAPDVWCAQIKDLRHFSWLVIMNWYFRSSVGLNL